jgi:predicted DNA-binding protein (UPF0251 family)/predicted Fe-Mo cluster-binding NifX family protein
MPRPPKCRLVQDTPEVTYFKPRGVPLRDLTEVYLSVEGFEALRLVDVAGLKHEEAALRMNVSRQTFSRVLAAARKAVAEAVILGQALRIEGGHYVVEGRGPETIRARAEARGRGPGRGRAFGRNKKTGDPAGPKEQYMSKIAVSSEGPSLDDQVDPRFGRAAGFVIVDPTTMEYEYLDNGASQARAQGAGIQAAELVAGRGVNVVLTGFVGPKAFTALRAAGIGIGPDLGGLSVRQAVERFVKGQVDLTDRPNR